MPAVNHQTPRRLKPFFPGTMNNPDIAKNINTQTCRFNCFLLFPKGGRYAAFLPVWSVLLRGDLAVIIKRIYIARSNYASLVNWVYKIKKESDEITLFFDVYLLWATLHFSKVPQWQLPAVDHARCQFRRAYF